MIPKPLRNLAAAVLLAGSTASMGIGVADGLSAPQCSIETASTESFRTTVQPMPCRDNIEGEAQEWFKIGLVGGAGVAGIVLAFPGAVAPQPQPEQPLPKRPRNDGKRREDDDESDDREKPYEA